jgi:hypothetical protein
MRELSSKFHYTAASIHKTKLRHILSVSPLIKTQLPLAFQRRVSISSCPSRRPWIRIAQNRHLPQEGPYILHGNNNPCFDRLYNRITTMPLLHRSGIDSDRINIQTLHSDRTCTVQDVHVSTGSLGHERTGSLSLAGYGWHQDSKITL